MIGLLALEVKEGRVAVLKRWMIVCIAMALALLLLAFRAEEPRREGRVADSPAGGVRPETELLPGSYQNRSAKSDVHFTEGSGPGVGRRSDRNSAYPLAESYPVPAAKPHVSVTGIAIRPSTLRLRIGMSDNLTAEVFPSNATDKTIIWQSSYPWMVECTPSGMSAKVTALSVGECLIIVGTRDGGHTAMCTVVATAKFAPDAGCSIGLCPGGDGRAIITRRLQGQFDAKASDLQSCLRFREGS